MGRVEVFGEGGVSGCGSGVEVFGEGGGAGALVKLIACVCVCVCVCLCVCVPA